MKILITGGLGYIGGRLAHHLSSLNKYDIILATRNGAYAPDWLSNAEVVNSKWESITSLEQICVGVHTVVHLAGMNAQDSLADPKKALDVNANATNLLLKSAIKQKVKRFIYLSTAHVYDSHLKGVITEETVTNNLHPYATSHRIGEDLVRNAHQKNEIKGIVIRLSNAFGAPMHKEANCWMLLANDLCFQAIKSKQLFLHTNGLQFRDFITLSDTVKAIEYLIGCQISKLGDGLYNLGGSQSLRVIDFAQNIAKRCNIVYGYEPNITRSKDATSYDLLEPLDYRIDKLLEAGFQLQGNGNDEIDATLRFCHNNFT
jgi:UDP-glucose 4-epimerase